MAGYPPVESEQPAKGSQNKPLTVSEALRVVKGTLKDIRLTIVGEVSEVSSKSSYKAVYFTVKDGSASLSCLMWNDLYRASGISLEVGQEVEIAGFFSLYAARGTMNFDVRRLSLAGEGRLRMEVARLARKLEAEGLMDPARKKRLPAFPSVVGIVTSPHSDAVQDVLRTLRRRWPFARVVLGGAQVEGAQAPAALIEALRRVAASDAELVILCRGGGSYENMMPFNDEGLARAIAACPIPVVTGIGHEPDNFIADMVADVRSSTPTGAVADSVPDQAEVLTLLRSRGMAMSAAMRHELRRLAVDVERLASRPVLRDATQLFAQEAMGVDYLAARLERALPAMVETRRTLVGQLSQRLRSALSRAGSRERLLLSQQRDRLKVALAAETVRFRQQMSLRASRLHDLSPLAILGRGYAVARAADGSIVKSVSAVSAGDSVAVSVSDGTLECVVEGTRHVTTGRIELDG